MYINMMFFCCHGYFFNEMMHSFNLSIHDRKSD